jgi:UDP-N-acetylglucosamine diphosphorylase / glucose-1-phosphate thymidylyltransferase / UDP-N-acetylgalactosamine diphosphorylase / glucosamine-1-phosphate N-acetyltransferase / galactosamine-1-phosphate N-acetyltransferase
MAGLGARFSIAGYKDPKPFIKIFDLTLIEIVLKNIDIKNAHYILIARSEHVKNYTEIIELIKKKYNVSLISLDGLTEGSACTVLHAHKLINNNTPLLLANSDQYIDSSIESFIEDCRHRRLDGSILTFVNDNKDPKWSYAKLNDSGLVEEVKEKDPISKYATVGLYYFSEGKFFVNGAIDMILAKDRVNNEFYSCPVYNYLISDNKKIGIYNIKSEQMHGLGTPEDLNAFVELKKCL